jgi:hypothetical protein
MTQKERVREARPFTGGIYRQEQDHDVITWTNKDLPRETRLYSIYGVSLFAMLPIAIFLSIRLWREAFLPVALTVQGALLFSLFIVIVCWLVIGGILYTLLRLTWTETITINQDGVTITQHGFLSWKPQHIPVADIWKLSFEKYKSRRDQESRYTVNIFHKRRHALAYWMRKEEAHQLYQLLSRIFNQRGWGEHILFEDNNNKR